VGWDVWLHYPGGAGRFFLRLAGGTWEPDGKTWEPDGKAELKSMKTDAIFASEKLIAATASRLRFWVRL